MFALYSSALELKKNSYSEYILVAVLSSVKKTVYDNNITLENIQATHITLDIEWTYIFYPYMNYKKDFWG